MIIYIGSDHKGFQLKSYIESLLRNQGYEVFDVGNKKYDENDDYPDFVKKLVERVLKEYDKSRGVLMCGSGAGVDIVANKYPGIRSSLVFNPNQAFDVRNDDDANVLSLPANYISEEEAKKIVVTWLETPFSGKSHHKRRLEKIRDIEREIAGTD